MTKTENSIFVHLILHANTWISNPSTKNVRFVLLILSAHSLSWSFQLITFPLQLGLSIASECVFTR
uniref:Putative ovule protein n=1 Tax=Solanum chacoense TaxID=4108 RepID=A0A0V0HAH5_SOLCH